MDKQLTKTEIDKIQKMCFDNPNKAIAVAQLVIYTCQVISCSTYAKLKDKSKRTIQYQAKGLSGVVIENRKFVSLVQ